MTLTKDHIENQANAITLPGQAFIDGAYRDASDEGSFDTIDPATGANLCEVAHCTSADVDKAAAACRSFEAGYRQSGSLSRDNGTEAMEQ